LFSNSQYEKRGAQDLPPFPKHSPGSLRAGERPPLQRDRGSRPLPYPPFLFRESRCTGYIRLPLRWEKIVALASQRLTSFFFPPMTTISLSLPPPGWKKLRRLRIPPAKVQEVPSQAFPLFLLSSEPQSNWKWKSFFFFLFEGILFEERDLFLRKTSPPSFLSSDKH